MDLVFDLIVDASQETGSKETDADRPSSVEGMFCTIEACLKLFFMNSIKHNQDTLYIKREGCQMLETHI